MKAKLMELVEELSSYIRGVANLIEAEFIKAKIQEIADELERRKWISVKDRLPEKLKPCLVAFNREDRGGNVVPNVVVYWDGNTWKNCFSDVPLFLDCVGSWIYKPLPQPPKEES